MTLPSPKICKRIRQLFRLIGSPNPNEGANARDKLVKLLAKHGLSWNDIPACVAAADADDNARAAPETAPPQGSAAGPEVNVLDLVLRLLELHVAITPEERMAVALWVLHTHVFARFTITPRLALLSPVRGCGKTTLLVLLDLLVADSHRTDNVTAAAIYYLLDCRPHSMLVDEGDNLGQPCVAFGVQFRPSTRWDDQSVRRRPLAAVSDLRAACCRGNRSDAAAVIASVGCHQHAAGKRAPRTPRRKRSFFRSFARADPEVGGNLFARA